MRASLFMSGIDPEAFAGHHCVPPREQCVACHHLTDDVLERNRRCPAELRLRLARVAEQSVDFRRTEVSWIDLNDQLSGVAVDAVLLRALCPPLDIEAKQASGELHELADRVLLPGGDYVIVRLRLLQHKPLGPDEVPCV